MQAAASSHAPPSFLGDSDDVAHRIVASAADLALLLDRDGVIVDVWLGEAVDAHAGWRALVGQRWADTVMRDSQRKVKQLVSDAFATRTTRAREINQKVEGVGEVPIRFSGALVADDYVLVPGRDIRPVAQMQQRLVSAQQAMDLEYRRLRQADTRYRVLFRVSQEGVLVVKDDRTVVEANPAAASLLGEALEDLRGQSLTKLFDAGSRDELLTLLGAVEAGAKSEAVLQPVHGDHPELNASASMFRQSGSLLWLLRLWRPGGKGATASARTSRMMRALEALPDGFVVTDEELHVLSANPGFCELVQRPNETHVVGQPLDRWLGRPGVDLNIIVANLQERGVVRDFSTIVRDEFDSSQEAMVTAVSATDGSVPCYGFTIRGVSSRLGEAPASPFLPRSVERLRGLVGRVSLKEIVRESTDMIERLCIEAALDVSSNNRAAAAQLLGLSRQSLYSKLRRHGLVDHQPG